MKKRTRISKLMTGFFASAFLLTLFPAGVFAQETSIDVPGKVYEFSGSQSYNFSSDKYSLTSDGAEVRGIFSVSGDILAASTSNGVPAYCTGNSNLSFSYEVTASAGDSSSSEDSSAESEAEYDGRREGSRGERGFGGSSQYDYGSGSDRYDSGLFGSSYTDSGVTNSSLTVQISSDDENWSDMYSSGNIFGDSYNSLWYSDSYNENTFESGVPFFTTTDVQELNGSYFRVIITYQTQERLTDRSFFNDYSYTTHAEVYEFYVYNNEKQAANTSDSSEHYGMGNTYKTDEFYIGSDPVDSSDTHYGWSIGDFFLTGYTSVVSDAEGRPVFLKDPGAETTLWFDLTQDIDALDGTSMAVVEDSSARDDYFNTGSMDFGRGALIIKYTDHTGTVHDPVIFTDFLENDASYGTDTKVRMLGEGDYEIALDYETESGWFFSKVSNYQLYLRFSVRSSGCAATPIDSASGADLSGSSMTDNGFYLDLADSHYLDITLSRSVINPEGTDLTDDASFTGYGGEGTIYNSEGIYTINVRNAYTGEETSRTLCVGTNKILKAHITTGLPISEINRKLEEGAAIDDTGNLVVVEVKTEKKLNSTVSAPDETTITESATAATGFTPLLVISLLSVAAGVILLVIQRKLD